MRPYPRQNKSRHGVTQPSGFTLIELTLVMAITGLLFVIIFIGQHELLARARFDTAISKTLQNISYARNAALANVNSAGNGNEPASLIAGVSFEMNNTHYDKGFPLEEVANLYAQPDGSGNVDISTLSEYPFSGSCPADQHPDDTDECQELFLNANDDLTVTSASVWVEVLYVRTGQGLKVCNRSSGSSLSPSQACAVPAAPFDITLSDPEGLSAQIEIDPQTGLARRL